MTDLGSMAVAPVGAGTARDFGFEVELEAAAPVWDLHAALGIDGLNWVNGLVNWRLDGRVDHRTYAFQEAGRCETGGDVRVTGLESYVSHEPRQLQITLGRAAGSVHTMDAEWLHGYTLTLLEPNENINGVDISVQQGPLIITQGTVRVVASDGEVGYGVIERDYRPSMLPSPEER
ncbi:hypothetical protein [Mycobacterium talmoniae]|nr:MULTISPECIES: hypothetical protein [Mycobacterium]